MAAEKWTFDLAHSNISFWVRHLMISKVRGRFTGWSGSLEFDEKNPAASRVEVQIDAASIDTREAQRDNHLRSPDFFDAAKFPHLTFKSTSVEKRGDAFQVRGDLTIRDTTRPIELEVEYAGRVKDPWGGERAGFSMKGSLNRKDFGLTWNQVIEAGGVAVSDKVEIAIEVEAVRQPVTGAKESAAAEKRA